MSQVSKRQQTCDISINPTTNIPSCVRFQWDREKILRSRNNYHGVINLDITPSDFFGNTVTISGNV